MSNWDMAPISEQAQKLVESTTFDWGIVQRATGVAVEDQKKIVEKLVTFMLQQPRSETISNMGFRVTRGFLGASCYFNIEFILDYAVIVWPQEV
jgi:hypothetical protein